MYTEDVDTVQDADPETDTQLEDAPSEDLAVEDPQLEETPDESLTTSIGGVEVEAEAEAGAEEDDVPLVEPLQEEDTVQAAPEVDWEKRYNDLRPWADKVSAEKSRWEKLGQDPDTIAESLKRLQDIESQQTLAPWNPKSQHNQKFRQVWERARLLTDMVSKASPEMKESLKGLVGEMLTPDDISMIQGYKKYSMEHDYKMRTDPNYFDNRIKDAVENRVNERMQHIEAESRVKQDFNDPVVAMVVREDNNFAQAMFNSLPYPQAIEQIKKHAGLLAKVKTATEASTKIASADERKRLTRDGARVESSPAVAKKGDRNRAIYKRAQQIAKDSGVNATHGGAWFRCIEQAESEIE